jgi:hypothetical protein
MYIFKFTLSLYILFLLHAKSSTLYRLNPCMDNGTLSQLKYHETLDQLLRPPSKIKQFFPNSSTAEGLFKKLADLFLNP